MLHEGNRWGRKKPIYGYMRLTRRHPRPGPPPRASGASGRRWGKGSTRSCCLPLEPSPSFCRLPLQPDLWHLGLVTLPTCLWPINGPQSRTISGIHDWQYKVFDLFSLHDEHRIFTTRLILFGDAYLFSMRGLFPIVVTYAALATIAALIIHIAVDKERSALAPIVGVLAIMGM